MSKFIKKATKKTTKPKKVEEVKVVEVPAEPKEVIKKGNQEFVVCPRCGWHHTPDTTKCRFCGSKI